MDWRKGLKTRREGERERKRGQSRAKYRGKGEKNNLHGNVCNPWVKGESKERWGEGRERERESDCQCVCVCERERERERKKIEPHMHETGPGLSASPLHQDRRQQPTFFLPH